MCFSGSRRSSNFSYKIFIIIFLIVTVNIFANNIERYELEIFKLINQYRISIGLIELQWEDIIAHQCRNFSFYLAQNNLQISHDGFLERIENIEQEIIVKSGAENVAYNLRVSNPCSVAVAGWLTSEGHKENIEGDFDLTGIGISQASDGSYYFTQIFIKIQESHEDIHLSSFEIEEEIFDIVNKFRVENNLEKLVWNELIAEQARLNSSMLIDSTKNNSEVFDIIFHNIENEIEILRISENISFISGYSQPAVIALEDWKNSSANWNNILGDFNLTGIGVFIDKNIYIYITQIFIKASNKN